MSLDSLDRFTIKPSLRMVNSLGEEIDAIPENITPTPDVDIVLDATGVFCNYADVVELLATAKPIPPAPPERDLVAEELEAIKEELAEQREEAEALAEVVKALAANGVELQLTKHGCRINDQLISDEAVNLLGEIVRGDANDDTD